MVRLVLQYIYGWIVTLCGKFTGKYDVTIQKRAHFLPYRILAWLVIFQQNREKNWLLCPGDYSLLVQRVLAERHIRRAETLSSRRLPTARPTSCRARA